MSPEEILAEIGPDAILLCYEASGKFCHRHIVAQWLRETLGIEVNELDSIFVPGVVTQVPGFCI